MQIFHSPELPHCLHTLERTLNIAYNTDEFARNKVPEDIP